MESFVNPCQWLSRHVSLSRADTSPCEGKNEFFCLDDHFLKTRPEDRIQLCPFKDTADGRNPAPPGMVKTL